MPLPRSFRFSATSLQDYVDCVRRFQLRYLLQVAWPAPEAEPISEQERHARLARDFHRLVHQHLLGLPADTLSASVHDPDLERWWQAYLAYVPTFDDARVMPEVGLSIPLSGYRVVAQYDAVVVRDQRDAERGESAEAGSADESPLLIVDWKTYRKRPSSDWLASRLQTRVYPLILVQAGASLIDHTRVEPGDVEMCYWLAEYPDTPERFPYDAATYQADLELLSALITEIDERIKSGRHETGTGSASATHDIWPLTGELRRCRFCNYRSLCGRGSVAGPVVDNIEGDDPVHLTADEIGPDFDLDWGQVQEIAY
jgi:hypothetical protein